MTDTTLKPQEVAPLAYESLESMIYGLRADLAEMQAQLQQQNAELVEAQKYILQLEGEVARLRSLPFAQRREEWLPVVSEDGEVDTDGSLMLESYSYDTKGDTICIADYHLDRATTYRLPAHLRLCRRVPGGAKEDER